MKTDVYRNDRIHVQKRMCSTCIFRPGNLMDLEPGRVDSMVERASAVDGCIPCHETIHRGGNESVCHGFHRLGVSLPLRVAAALGRIEWTEVSSK